MAEQHQSMAEQQSNRLEDIFAWQRIDERLTTSGQPSEAQLAAIAGTGVTHVVNLGLHEHPRALPDEASSVAALGMVYVHIPVDFDAPSESDLDAFAVVIDDLSDRQIHVHCIANLRVSAFLYRYRIARQGWSEADARRDMERIWRPGGVWATFVGDTASTDLPHRYAGRDY